VEQSHRGGVPQHARSDRFFRATRRRVEVTQEVVVSLMDDLDGSRATETVEFALDGKTYEIDLSSTNAGKLRDTLASYTTAARKSARSPRSTRGTVSAAPRFAVVRKQPHAIREWARAQGMRVTDRGRIPAAIIDAYHDRT
jgi:hypothetical protein